MNFAKIALKRARAVLACAVVACILFCTVPVRAHAGDGAGERTASTDLAVAGLVAQQSDDVANYAVYSSSDNSLTFLHSDGVPTSEVLGKPVTSVYPGDAEKGWAIATYNRVFDVPWWYVMRRIESIEFRDVTRPVSCAYWFCQANLVTEVDCENLDFDGVALVEFMFFNCYSLKSVANMDLSGEASTSMRSMFQQCAALETVDLSRFGTSNVWRMDEMFSGCTSLPSVDLSSFDTVKVQKMNDMFKDCTSLTSVKLGERFSFKGGGKIYAPSWRGLLPDPPANDGVHNGKWSSPAADSIPQFTPAALQEAYDGATMAGVYVWSEGEFFKLEFDGNGGTGSMGPLYVEVGSRGMMPECGFSRDGWVFAGWSTCPDGSGDAIAPGGQLAVAEDMVLYAQWEEARVVIEVLDRVDLDLYANGRLEGAVSGVALLKNRGNVPVRLTGVRVDPSAELPVAANPSAIGEYDAKVSLGSGVSFWLSDCMCAAPDYVDVDKSGKLVAGPGESLTLTGIEGTTPGVAVSSWDEGVAAGTVSWKFSAA